MVQRVLPSDSNGNSCGKVVLTVKAARWPFQLRSSRPEREMCLQFEFTVPFPCRQQLSEVFDVVAEVNVLDSRDNVNLALLTRPDLGITFTKLHCWRLTQFSKCVFLDADTLVSLQCLRVLVQFSWLSTFKSFQSICSSATRVCRSILHSKMNEFGNVVLQPHLKDENMQKRHPQKFAWDCTFCFVHHLSRLTLRFTVVRFRCCTT